MQLASNPKQTLDAESSTEFSAPFGKLSFESGDGGISGCENLISVNGTPQSFRRLSEKEVAALSTSTKTLALPPVR